MSSVDTLVDSLRETNLLRADQFNQLVDDFLPRFEGPPELAKHIVKLGWITLYQAKKLLSGHGKELILGNYVILDKLGEGGMGKVYKARQLRLSRTVALKVVRPNLVANETALKRFHLEAKAAAKLAHPNIVRLFDADQVGDRHFLALEYVEGNDLAKLVRETGPLPVGMACSFLRQAAAGLQHAHDQGLIHRDIKPSNLLVSNSNKTSKFDPGGAIKILDMGLARVSRQEEDDASALTQDGTVIGTPDFMSPEQAKNSSLVDARSDLYSLGCTAYFLLSGQSPFPIGSTLEKLMQHQMDAPIHIQMKRQDVPSEVAAIVHKLLAKKPNERFQSGDELAIALEPWSIFDSSNQRLTSSVKIGRPQTFIPEAMPVSEEVVDPVQTDPFDFDETEPAPAPPPAPPTPVASPAKKKVDAVPEPPRKKRRIWLLAAAVLILGLFVGGALIAWSLLKESPAKNLPAVAEEINSPKKEPPGKPADSNSVDFYLPPDTELIAVLNMKQLSASKYFQDGILPKLNAALRKFRAPADFDPFKATDRAIVAIPDANPLQWVAVIQGSDMATPRFLAWAKALPGVAVTTERVSGLPRELYFVPAQKNKEAGKSNGYYGAVLSTNPGTVVVSTNKDRVIEALGRVGNKSEMKFNDASLRPQLAKFPPKKPAALWLCLGNESKLISTLTDKKNKTITPRESGIIGMTALLGLGETLTADIEIEAKNKQSATAASAKIVEFFRATAAANKNGQRFAKIAALIQSAAVTPLKGPAKQDVPNMFQGWTSISSDKLAEFFAPFLATN